MASQTASTKTSLRSMEATSIDSIRLRSIEQSTVNWPAIFAGAFISLLSYFILTCLGMAFGGRALLSVIQGADSTGLGVGSGIWVVLSVIISLFIGGYSAARASGLISLRVGRIQGAVIAALFFGFMFAQVGSTLGALTKGLGSTVGAVGSAAGEAVKNPEVQETINQSLKGLKLKSPPDVVARNIATRVLSGDSIGARDYLAREAGISSVEADRRIRNFTANAQNTLENVGGTTAKVVSILGWSLFGTLALGTLFGVLGGGAGARGTLFRPNYMANQEKLRTTY